MLCRFLQATRDAPAALLTIAAIAASTATVSSVTPSPLAPHSFTFASPSMNSLYWRRLNISLLVLARTNAAVTPSDVAACCEASGGLLVPVVGSGAARTDSLQGIQQ